MYLEDTKYFYFTLVYTTEHFQILEGFYYLLWGLVPLGWSQIQVHILIVVNGRFFQKENSPSVLALVWKYSTFICSHLVVLILCVLVLNAIPMALFVQGLFFRFCVEYISLWVEVNGRCKLSLF